MKNEGKLTELFDSLRPMAAALAQHIKMGLEAVLSEELAKALGPGSGLAVMNLETASTSKAAKASRRGRPAVPDSERPKCSVTDCQRSARSKGLCSAHYQKQLRAKEKAIPTTPEPGQPPKAVKPRRAKAKKAGEGK